MSASELVDRLHGVRRTGTGRYVARCPAHKDKSPSLSVRELEDGRVLLHCFAGCDAASVLAAVDLSMESLFPERLETSGRPVRRPWPAADLLNVIDFESLVVVMTVAKRVETGSIGAGDLARVTTARERLWEVSRWLPR